MTYEELQSILRMNRDGQGVPTSLGIDQIISGIQSQYTPEIQQLQNQGNLNVAPDSLINAIQNQGMYGANRFIDPSAVYQESTFSPVAQQFQSFLPSEFDINKFTARQQDSIQEVSPPVLDYISGNVLSPTNDGSSPYGADGAGGFSAQGLGQASSILGAIAAFSKDSSLYSFAKNLGAIAAIASAETAQDLAVTLGSMALQGAGVSAPVVGLIANAIKGNAAGMANNALSLASPELALVNGIFTAATGLFGDMPTSFGDVVTQYGFGSDVFENAGIIDATQGAKVLNSPKAQDALGALMAIVGSQNGADVSNLPTGAATTAANAISVAENVNSLDALLGLTNAYGTGTKTNTETIQPVPPEPIEPVVVTPQEVPVVAPVETPVEQPLEMPIDVSLPAYVAPVMPDFSVDTSGVLKDTQDQLNWANNYFQSQNAGLTNAYDSLINALQQDQQAQLAIGGVPVRGGSVEIIMGDGDQDSSTINQYTYPSYSAPEVPSYIPVYTPPVYDYTAPAVPPSYVSPSYTPSFDFNYLAPSVDFSYSAPSFSW